MEPTFPSLRIRRDALEPRGAFAQAQATFLRPDPRAVSDLHDLLRDKNIGVVAHFYMDVELQGILTACPWPHIQISDSLAMADRAVKMAEAGVRRVVVLGVDFMSENVRAVLDAAGHTDVAVWRLSSDAIGCSLAESAERAAYTDWLGRAAATPRSLHVVYINTSLITKARSHAIVPTITCTSSNVVRTVLQAAAQIPDVSVWYGPDTYMGHNLAALFAQLCASATDDDIRALHPDHDRASVASLLERFHTYEQGTCVVHHMFGADVAERVRAEHPDALLSAHLEVPGEMFALAAEAARAGRGVVGSTSNILGFIREHLARAVARPGPAHLEVVLGTEAGMITSIVDHVQGALGEHGRDDVTVEIVFPVASEAVAQAPDSPLQLVPGVAGGEGCTPAGGCATCPFMKMNSLEALFDVLELVGTEREGELQGFLPRVYAEQVAGRTAADLGSEPILAMRHLQRTGELPPELVALVKGA